MNTKPNFNSQSTDYGVARYDLNLIVLFLHIKIGYFEWNTRPLSI